MTESESTALFEAIGNNDLTRTQSLLDSNPALASAKNDKGVSAVLTSIYSGRKEIRDLLIARGAHLELQDAVAAGKLDAVKSQVEKNPSLAKAFSPDGFPLVALAAVFDHGDVARYLAEKGADVNAVATNGSGYNALTGAVASGHTEIVRWLLASGANPNYRYGPGYTPLHTAAANGHLEIVRLLLDHGADRQVLTDDGKSAADIATERKHPEIAAFLKG